MFSIIAGFLTKHLKFIVIGAAVVAAIFFANRLINLRADLAVARQVNAQTQAALERAKEAKAAAEARERKIFQDFSKSRVEAEKNKQEIKALQKKISAAQQSNNLTPELDAEIEAEFDRIFHALENVYSGS